MIAIAIAWGAAPGYRLAPPSGAFMVRYLFAALSSFAIAAS